jgi:hypothetical protein
MQLIFTRHSKNKMRYYRLSDEDIFEIIQNPEQTIFDNKGHNIYIKKILTAEFCVVAEIQEYEFTIITIFPKKYRGKL